MVEYEQSLYSNIQNVVMPNGKTKDLRVDVVGLGKPISKVEVRITDDNDPSLLYILHVSESDFNVIKSQQGLLVDFSNFPIHLVKLLEQCLNSVKGFLLILEQSGLENYLKVVQPIDLKNLCYIALRIAQGSDSEVMRHMHSQIILLKKKLFSKEEDCSCFQSQVSQLQQELHSKEDQIARNLRQWEEERTRLQNQFEKDMDSLREQLLKDRKRDLDSAEHQRETLNAKLEDLSKEASKYKNKYMQLCEKHDQAQQTIRELNMRTSSSEEAQRSINRELADLRRLKADLESELRRKDHDLDQARANVDALDKELVKLRSRLTRQETLLRQADSEQVRLKTAITRSQETIEARNDLVLQLNGDLTKANLIIKERQKELDKMHHEMKKLVSLKNEEESKNKNMELEMKLLRANSDRDEIRIRALEEAEKKLQEKLKEAHDKISFKDEQHKKCGELISFLNRSLNRQHLEPSPPSTAHGVPQSALYNSAPSAPILYTMGSSLGRAGAAVGLHASGPPLGALNTNAVGMTAGNRAHPLPFSSTPLVASAAAGGVGTVNTGSTTRRSYPGASIQPTAQVQRTSSASNTPSARPATDRMTMAQMQTKDASTRVKKTSISPPDNLNTQSNQRTQMKRSQSASGITNLGSSKEKVAEQFPVGKTSNKENRESVTYKPSAYFQPNKIITEF